MTGRAELVVHIGTGKAGSTAIQRVLEEERARLAEQGIGWLGRLLEHAPGEERAGWQRPGGDAALFHGLPPERAAAEIHTVLSGALETAAARGMNRLVWSHEAIFARREGVAPALTRLAAEGWPVRAVVYLRRHDRWAQSAYAQWGLRHKSYEGPVRPFSDWIAERPPRFAAPLRFWAETLGTGLEPVNLDVAGDAAADVVTRIGAVGIAGRRVYKTPAPAALLAQAIHNGRFPGEVTPDRFQRLGHALGRECFDASPLPEPAALFPTAADLAEVRAEAADDIAEVNAILARYAAPPLSFEPPAPGAPPPSDWETTQVLFRMVLSLQEQVIRLRRRLDEIER